MQCFLESKASKLIQLVTSKRETETVSSFVTSWPCVLGLCTYLNILTACVCEVDALLANTLGQDKTA